MTRDEIIAQLKAIERLLASRLTIERVIIAADGTVVGTIRKSVVLKD